MTNSKIIIDKRRDGTWGWALVGDNGGSIIATDGHQGYEDRGRAEAMAKKIVSGHYAEAEVLYEVPRPGG